VRWTAWYSFWEDQYYVDMNNAFDGEENVRPLRLSLEIAPDLVQEISAGGWIGYDGDRDRIAFEDWNWYEPWERRASFYSYDDKRYELLIGSEKRLDDGSLRVALDFDAIRSVQSDKLDAEGPFTVDEQLNDSLSKYDVSLNSDLGVRLDFPAGTFRGVDAEAYEDYRLERGLPYALVLGLAALVFAAAVGATVAASRARRGANASHRTVGMLAIPLLAIAQSIVFFWAIMSMPGSDAGGVAAIVVGTIMWVAVGVGMIVTGKHSKDLAARDAAARKRSREAQGRSREAQENGDHD
jgi:hypothetical protein